VCANSPPHCGSLDGLVVTAAKRSLELVLPFVWAHKLYLAALASAHGGDHHHDG
jgi:hypothetical protein